MISLKAAVAITTGRVRVRWLAIARLGQEARTQWPQVEDLGPLMPVNGRLSFAYWANWLQNPQAQALSHLLLLRAELFDDRATRPFFASLLPGGDKRGLVAQAFAPLAAKRPSKPAANTD